MVPGRCALRASAGLSYRTPSFDELFWAPRASAAGNPDLRREVGRDADLGITLQIPDGSARLDVEGFVRTVDDLIQWIPGANGIWRPHNVGAARIAGLEVGTSLQTRLPRGHRLRFDASASHLRSRDRTGAPNVDGKELVYRPRWTAAFGAVLLRPGGDELESTWRFVDDVWVTRANTKILPGRIVGDVRWRRPLAGGLRVDVAITNVTGETARDFRDYPLPGRVWQLGLAWERTIK